MKKILLIGALIFLTLPGIAHVAHAADFKPIVPLPGLTEQQYQSVTFPQYINLIFKWSIAVGAILAVLMLIYGGFQYMTSDATGEKKKGLDRIRNAIIGLLLLLSVFIILNVINPCILEINALSLHPGQCSPQQEVQAPQQTDEQVAASRQGAYHQTDGSCVIFSPTACISGNQPVIKCSQGDNSLIDRPQQGCGNLTEAYVCEQSACGSPPIAVPQGAHTYTGNEASCMENGTHCPQGFQATCRNLHEACVFPGDRYSDRPNSGGCPHGSQSGFICLDGVSESLLGGPDTPTTPPANTTPSDAAPIPHDDLVIARGATCPAAQPHSESICRYGNDYTVSDNCVPDSAKATLCIHMCSDTVTYDHCFHQ